MPAQPQAASLRSTACGALSVPRKNFGEPEVGGAAHRQPVPLALGHRQAISVRAEPAVEHRVAVDDEMVRRDRRGDVRPGAFDEGHRLGGGDMLEDDLQRREVADQPGEHALDEHRLAVEDVDLRIGDLAMDQQRHADPLHRLQRRAERGDVGDAVRGVGGGVGGIELGRRQDARLEAARDLGRIGMVGQIAGHQRREVAARRQGGEDARRDRPPPRRRRSPAAPGSASRSRARTAARCRPATASSIVAVAQVDVPVVGAADDETGWIGHAASP